MQIYLCVVCATIHACSNTCVAWLFPSRVNLHVTSHVNIDFHGKFWHSAREKRRGATRGMYRVCEVVVELYRNYIIIRMCIYIVHSYSIIEHNRKESKHNRGNFWVNPYILLSTIVLNDS